MRSSASKQNPGPWLDWVIAAVAISLLFAASFATALAVSVAISLIFPTVEILLLSLDLTIYPLFFLFRPIYRMVCSWFGVPPYEKERPYRQSHHIRREDRFVAHNESYED